MENERDIISSGEGTALLVCSYESDGSEHYYFGTAFFVTEKILLTAGHMLTQPGTINTIRVTTPGIMKVDLEELKAGRVSTLDCTIIENLYKLNNLQDNKDIAFLECAGFNAAITLPLSSDPLPPDAVVDIIGYPGRKRIEWIQRHHGFKIKKDLKKSQIDAEDMLPTRCLTVTSGSVINSDAGLISHRVSTCPGMSGSPLLYKGKVFGISSYLINAYYLGIHVRQKCWDGNGSVAISFEEKDIRESLEMHLLKAVPTSVGSFLMVRPNIGKENPVPIQ